MDSLETCALEGLHIINSATPALAARSYAAIAAAPASPAPQLRPSNPPEVSSQPSAPARTLVSVEVSALPGRHFLRALPGHHLLLSLGRMMVSMALDRQTLLYAR